MPVILGLTILAMLGLVYVTLQPADFRVDRVVLVRAPLEIVFFHVSELRKFNAWNPWMKMDPRVRINYEGPPSGPGAAFSWEGNTSLGHGSMTVTECVPGSHVRFLLHYERPFRGSNQAEIVLREEENHEVRVTWSIYGRNGFVPRLFSLLLWVNTDKLIGSILASGLAGLKSIAEGSGDHQ